MSKKTPNPPNHNDFTPSLPPAIAPLHDKPASEILAELNKMPLFMTTMEENDDVEALRALAYEGTPLEVAGGFKEHGNESFSKKKWKDAKIFYEKAIDVLLIEEQKRQRGDIGSSEASTETEREKQQEISLLEICLVNRAACHLELQNYRSAIHDCGKALKINPRNIKAYYRSSKALLALDKLIEAKDACECGLAIDPNNKSLCSIAKAIVHRSSILAMKEKETLERAEKKRLETKTLKAALQARNIIVRKTSQPSDMDEVKIKLVPDPVDPTSTLCFPTLFLYPMNMESDLIKEFNETQCLNDHLEYILPLPWDMEHTYTLQSVECYVETTTGGLSKVGKKVPLLKVLATGSIVVLDELIKIFVVPRSNAAAWVADFKKRKNLKPDHHVRT
ncbi:Hsp70/Hsp90 co-chaperone CNS1 [Erysiphe neolycopersici]|uniref:Hsp70/Hsp90 co-chaperone CNS1 n=1 Tax=Erysiphe neolycopersici TaxID=212602 RepID=A0A420I858_9PEZI|nr:Hsp70/Hsp90 co-chaperone CNS1 [Erysiphe neolycopersici]